MRESTKDALNKFYERQAREDDPLRPHRKNEKPEFEFAKQVDKWFQANGWVMSRVESKAVYNFASGRYDHGQTESGFSDRVGVTPYRGVAAFIELKAPGRRGTLKEHQRDFLVRQILANAFAACIDNTDALKRLYSDWRKLRESGAVDVARGLLVKALPVPKHRLDRLSDLLDESE